jgi:hypothetical protein
MTDNLELQSSKESRFDYEAYLKIITKVRRNLETIERFPRLYYECLEMVERAKDSDENLRIQLHYLEEVKIRYNNLVEYKILTAGDEGVISPP